jgi:hypothetical protein
MSQLRRHCKKKYHWLISAQPKNIPSLAPIHKRERLEARRFSALDSTALGTITSLIKSDTVGETGRRVLDVIWSAGISAEVARECLE